MTFEEAELLEIGINLMIENKHYKYRGILFTEDKAMRFASFAEIEANGNVKGILKNIFKRNDL